MWLPLLMRARLMPHGTATPAYCAACPCQWKAAQVALLACRICGDVLSPPNPMCAQYCLNLSAPFICEVPPFKKTLMDLMPYVDYLFGNGGCCCCFFTRLPCNAWEGADGPHALRGLPVRQWWVLLCCCCSPAALLLLCCCHSWSCSTCATHALAAWVSSIHPTRHRSAMRAENEARAFAKSEGWETEDVEEIALRVGGVEHPAGGC